MLLEHGYNDLGLAALLARTGIPKGSFYHHFKDKEAFALEVVDAYMRDVHRALDATLGDQRIPPLQRIRGFFSEVAEGYRRQGYMGCLLGGLGQELSGVSEKFRKKIAACFEAIGNELTRCLSEAQERGEMSSRSDPAKLALLLVDCWEGAALRSRLHGDPGPLDAMLDFYFQALEAQPRAVADAAAPE